MARPDADASMVEAVAARLCHDLAGLAGTVAAMLDLARDPREADEALPLAREAAGDVLRRLRLARAAWGGAGDWPDHALPDLAALVATERLAVTLDDAAILLGRDARAGRLLLNILLLGAEAARGRGAIGLAAAPDGALAATLGGGATWPDLAVPPPEGPRHFQRLWTLRLAAASGTRLAASGPRLRIIPPA